MNKTTSKLALQNKLASSPVLTRSYFPDYPSILSRLIQLKNAVKSGEVTQKDAIRSELISSMQMAEKLGIYYDYCDHTHYADQNGVYGATVGQHGFGGGQNYLLCQDAVSLVSTDDELHDALLTLKEGQILLVTKDSCLELSDYLIAGETIGFDGEKIDYQWTIEKDRAWVGERGVDGCAGAILKFNSYTDCCILMGENARLSGLVIQGPDRPSDSKNADSNFSVGIVVKGDGAVIENCEISAFFRAGIRVVDSKNVKICNNYFHDISSPASGYAVLLENSRVEMKENLFSNLSTVAFVSDTSSVVFADNIDAGNLSGVYFAGKGSVHVSHNTLLSPVDLFADPLSVSVENNLFAYAPDAYFATVMTDSFINNVFDVTTPALYSGDAIVSKSFKPFSINKQTVVSAYDTVANLPVLSGSYYNETNDEGYLLLKKWIVSGNEEGEALVALLNNALSAIGGYTNYLSFNDRGLVSFEVDGQRYGAYSDNDPIGGGVGYSRIVTTGDYIVTNEEELKKALEVAKAGEVIFMPSGTYINISNADENTVRTLTVPGGVTLASDRGRVLEDGSVSTGAVIATSAMFPGYIMFVGGENARLTGFVLKGPDPGRHVSHHTRSFFREPDRKILYKYYWKIPNTHGVQCLHSNVEFDNLEICGFNTIGLGINNKENPPTGVKVHHCYVHHCQIKGLGYGVRFDHGYAEVKHNIFNYNRHSIAGGGYADSGYIAENNIEMGESLDHYFDMHGGRDRGDGTNIAGEYVEIRNNTFLGVWRPFVLRGHPVDHQDFSFNVVYDNIETSGKPLQISRGERVENAHVGKNAWEISRGIIEIIDGVQI